MAVTAKFLADFSDFSAAVAKAQAKFTEFRKESAQVENQLKRVTDGFLGRKILSEAQLAVKAVQEIDGVTKLTAKEQQNLNALLSEALAKYQALGKTAPKEMVELEKATRQAEQSTSVLSTKVVAVGAAIGTALGNIATNAIQS